MTDAEIQDPAGGPDALLESEGLFVCAVDDCKRQYSTVKDLRAHVKSDERHQQRKYVPCATLDCPAFFESLSELIDHFRTSHSESGTALVETRYYCPYSPCAKSYTSGAALTLHIKRSKAPGHFGNRFRCTIEGCEAVFPDAYALRIHLTKSRAHAAQQWPCTMPGCTNAYSSQAGLWTHLYKSVAHAATRLACSWPGCKKLFHSTETLSDHMLVKHKTRSSLLRCSQSACKEVFISRESLSAHLPLCSNDGGVVAQTPQAPIAKSGYMEKSDRHRTPQSSSPCHATLSRETTLSTPLVSPLLESTSVISLSSDGKGFQKLLPSLERNAQATSTPISFRCWKCGSDFQSSDNLWEHLYISDAHKAPVDHGMLSTIRTPRLAHGRIKVTSARRTV